MKISIITPSHNPKYLYELEESLINQTYNNWEWILILNNGAYYTPKNVDERIKIINSDRKMNSVGAWKKLASNHTTGEIIAEVDHDDFLTHDCLYEVAKAYNEDPEVGFVYSKTIYIQENGEFIPYDKAHGWEYEYFNWKDQQLITMNELPLYPGNLGYIVYSPNHIRTWKRDLYMEVGGHNQTLQICDDHDLMIRLYLKTKFKYIDKPLYFYRITGDNTWLKHSKKIQILSNLLYDKNIKKLSLRYCELKNLKNITLNNDNINNLINIESNSVGLIEFTTSLKREDKTVQFLEEVHRVLHPGGMFLCEYEFNKKDNVCGEDDFYQFLYERNAYSEIDLNQFWFRERKVKTVIQNNKTVIYFHVMKDDFNNQKRLIERNIKEIEWTGDKLNIYGGWNGLENYMESIINGFNINNQTALEFGVEHGYSTYILSQLFENVIGVDTFEGDVHAGFKNLYDEVKNRFENTNVDIIKSDFRDFIKNNDKIYDLIHIDIVHTYEDTYECADWAVQHSKVVLLHDTISYPDINRVCVDLSKKHNLEYYNISKYYGLGILHNPKIGEKINDKNINIFYHCYAINDWKERFEKTYNLIVTTKLINQINNIFVNFDGDEYEYFNKFNKIKLIKSKERFKSEGKTIDLLHNYSKENDGYTLYLHGKGVQYTDKSFTDWWYNNKVYYNINLQENVNSWVDLVLYFNIEKWELCLNKLNEGYDTIGAQYSKIEPHHYSGNFWWANNKYLRNLDNLIDTHRTNSESWIGTNPNNKYYNLYSVDKVLYAEKIEREEYDDNSVNVYDSFLFFNELDLLEIRLNYLDDVVDYFVLVEADKTHSGKPKPYYYEENKERFKDFHHKIIHIKKEIDTTGMQFEKRSFSEPNKGKDFWIVENEQRDGLKEVLGGVKNNDIIIISDIDEIPSKDVIFKYRTEWNHENIQLNQKLHYYYLNSKFKKGFNDEWFGSCILRKHELKSPQEARNERCGFKKVENGGWHFSYLGGIKKIKEKIISAAHSEYQYDYWLDEKKIKKCVEGGEDIFERYDHKMEYININDHKDEYPDYLVNNLDKYNHLIKPIKKEKVYDCFTFFNELDLLEIRLNYLDDVVDYFVLVEADKTHSGKPKPYYYEENKERFKDFHHKIIHIKTILDTEGLTFEKNTFQNRYDGGDRWILENNQRNAISDGLINSSGDDIIIIGDIDEIPNKEKIKEYINSNLEDNVTLIQQNHMYYLNHRTTKESMKNDIKYGGWWGSALIRMKNITSPQEVRDDRYLLKQKVEHNGGWHFTYLGGMDSIINKIHSFAHSEYDNEDEINKIRDAYKKNVDFFNTVGPNEYEFINLIEKKDEYPKYLIENINKYKHLIKEINTKEEKRLMNGFDDHLIDVYKKHIKEDSVIIDAGGYVGEHTLLFSKLGHTVHSFEPRENSFNKMISLLNKEGVENVITYNLGLSDTEETKIKAYINNFDVDYVLATLHFEYNKEIDQKEYENQKEFKLITIDSLNLDRIDFIKIDVEGYETKVLRGGLETIKKSKPIIVLECWDYSEEKFKDLINIGYVATRINENKPDYLFTPKQKNPMKPKMVLFMGYAPSILDDKKGGSEIMAYKLCESLKNNYEIHVFGCHNNYEIRDDVYYHNINELKEFQKNNEIEILLISRYIYYFLEFEITAKKTFIWFHDYYFMAYHNFKLLDNWGKDLISKYEDKIDGYICLTQWHKEFVHSHYGMDINKIHIIGNAIDTNNWNEPNKNIKNRFIWVSRHERGLDNLLKIFPKIQKRYPDSELFIYGPYDNKDEFNYNINIINSNEKIHYGGLLTNEELIKEFQKSNFWLYPTEFAETYCISALEAQMSGCIPIASDYAALSETISKRGVLIPYNENKGVDDDYEKNALNEIFDLMEDNNKQKEYIKRGLNWAKEQTFENRKQDWLNLFNNNNNQEPIKDLVSVIIPYNEDRGYLNQAIESVKKQTYKNIELILVNDKKNRSILANRGIKQSKGEYIRILDEDDYLPSDSIEKSINAIKNTDFDLVHGNARIIEDNEDIGVWVPLEGCQTYEYALYRKSHCLNNMSVLYKRRVFDVVGLYDENFFVAQDLDFFIRCYKNKNIKIKYLNEILINYRHHNEQITKKLLNDGEKKKLLHNFWDKEIKEYQKKPKPILCLFMGYAPFILENGDGWGGSELTVKQLSEELIFWYDVYVFGASYKNIEYNGVKYRNINTLKNFQKNNKIEIMIVVRYLYYFLEFPITANKTYLWAHDYTFLPFHDFETLENRGQYLIDEYDNQIDGYIALTQWHKDFLSKSHNINKNKINIIGNGIKVDKWKNNIEKVKNRFIWTSSPDRGLNHLLELFPTILEKHPDAELYIYGHEVEWYPINWDIINNPNIHYLGKRPNEEVLKMFQSSEYWFYPTDYYDTFNISALEAQMSKTICITSNMGGIAETVGNRGVLIDYYGSDLIDYSSTNGVDDEYKNKALTQLFDLMDNEALKEEYRNKGYEWAKKQNWQNRVSEWFVLFNKEKKMVRKIKEINNNKKFTFHVLGIFYTKTTKEYSPDPFTQQTRLICKMLTNLGHTVYHYGTEGSNPICTENITVLSEKTFNDVYKNVNWKTHYFETTMDSDTYREFNKNAIREINKRKEKNHFLLCPYGVGHKEIADGTSGDLIVVEPDIGYGETFAPYRVFTTYAWMHYIYGTEKPKDLVYTPNLYDAVIPHSFDLDDYIYSDIKEDYFFFIGRIIELKGIEIIKLVAENLKIKIYVAGQGELPFKSKWVEHIGVVNFEERAKWMSKAKGVFAPTLYNEPFGMNIIESYLCGTPVITTDFGSFSELVIHGKTGYRCRTTSEFIWAAKNIHKIKPSDCREFGESNYCLEKISEMFSHYFNNLYNLHTKNGGWYYIEEMNNLNWLNKKY